MSKTIISPVARFPGRVVLADPLTFPQSLAWEGAIDRIQALRSGAEGDALPLRRVNYILLEPICQIVERWEVEGIPENVTPDTFPATPQRAVANLVGWLTQEITALFNEGDEIPNAS